jgi:TRAP-type C4-dicarboxylate transport system substrate-binding protein
MKMKKRRWVLCAALLLTVGLLSACGGSSNNEAVSDEGDGAETTADAAADANAAPEFTLSFASYNPQDSNISKFEVEAIKRIEEQSNGRIKIDAYWNGTLLDAMDTWSGTASGLADISYYYITLSSGVQTVGEVFTQYYAYKAPDMVNTLTGFRQVLDTIPEIRQEAEAANLYILDVLGPSGACYIMTKDVAVQKPEDMRGMTVMAQGRYSDVLQSVGASGVSLPPSDWYTSLERGVVDALTMNWSGVRNFGLEELGKTYVTFGDNGGLYCGGQAYLVNLDTWNGMPSDLQQIVVDGFRWADDQLAAYDQEDSKQVMADQIAEGKTVYHVEEADMGPWYALAQQAADLWIEDCNAKGYDGRAIWDKFVSIMESQN